MVELVTFLQSNTNVIKLVIRNSNIDDQGIKILVKDNLSNLTPIDSRFNYLGYYGAKALSESNLLKLT